MLGSIKYVVIISLICRLCNGENIQKCFTLNKIIPDKGNISFDWQNRRTNTNVNLHCTNGLILIRQITFSIARYEIHKCLVEECSDNVGYQRCACCRKPLYSAQLCNRYSQVDTQSKNYCESRKECSISIGIMDLSGYCANQKYYSCDQGWCYSRWVEVHYTCVPGMDMKLLYQHFFINMYSSNV